MTWLQTRPVGELESHWIARLLLYTAFIKTHETLRMTPAMEQSYICIKNTVNLKD